MTVWIDTETYNELPLRNGTYVYAASCEPMIVTYALGNEPVHCWDRTADPKLPDYLLYLLHDTDDVCVAHNAMFDRNVLKYGLGIDIPIKRWKCNMVRALAHALPGGLDALCGVLGVELSQAKLKTGKKLIHLFCKPQPFKHSIPKGGNAKDRKAAIEAAKAAWTGRATRLTHPEQWAEFLEYAKSDITAMQALDKKIPNWNYQGEELALYHLDQTINDRGFLVDTDLAQAAVRAVERAKASLADRTQDITSYDEETNTGVESTTKRDQLLAYILREYGIDLPDMQMATLERRIADADLPAELRELLIIRLQASSTSTSKYTALLKAVSADGRLRGALQFDGASRTRRWAGRTFQPQNLRSKGLPPYSEIEFAIEAMKGDYEDIVLPNVMESASFAVRGCIIAPPGKKLVISDLANIEGRVCAWLAGEEWKLQAFRDYDTVKGKDGKWYTGPELHAAALRHEYIELERDEKGEPVRKGPDLYKLSYARAFKVAIEEVTKAMRQIGKVSELMLQYEGGVGAWVTGAATYGIDLEELARTAYETLPGEVVHEAEGFLEWTRKEKRGTFGLSDQAFVTCDSLKRLWRGAHPAITSLWKDLKEGSIEAIENPGNTVKVRKFRLRRDGAWFRIQLPSKGPDGEHKHLCYPSPKVNGKKITYMGNSQYTRRWTRLGTYGGKQTENACQGLAGDVMKANMPTIEDHEYDILFSVHDELPTEAPDTPEFNADHLSALLATVPSWAEGMPLSAAGFECTRYRKGD